MLVGSMCGKRLWGRSGWMGESGRQPGSQAEKRRAQILRFSDSRSHGDLIFFWIFLTGQAGKQGVGCGYIYMHLTGWKDNLKFNGDLIWLSGQLVGNVQSYATQIHGESVSPMF